MVDGLSSTRDRSDQPSGECLLVGLTTVVLSLVVAPLAGGALLVVSSSVLTIVLGGTPLRRVVRGLLVPLVFILLGTIGLALSVRLMDDGLSVEYSPSGMRRAIEAGIRALAATSGLLTIGAAAPVTVLLSLAAHSPLPPVVVELAGLLWRWLWLMSDTFTRMRRAEEARLGSRNWHTRMRSLGSILAMLLVRSLARARRIEAGLAARGYTGTLRVATPSMKFSPRRAFAAVSLQLATVALGSWVPWGWP